MPNWPRDQHLGSTIIKLLIASFLVGLVLSFLDIDPLRLFEHFWDTVHEVVARVASFIQWSARYVALGAIVVVPLWLIPILLRSIGRRTRSPAPPSAAPPPKNDDTLKS